MLLCGVTLDVLGAVLVGLGLTTTNADGSAGGNTAAVVVGAVIGVVGLPLMLIGVLAVGIRIGLREAR